MDEIFHGASPHRKNNGRVVPKGDHIQMKFGLLAALAFAANQEAETIVFDLVNPHRAGRGVYWPRTARTVPQSQRGGSQSYATTYREDNREIVRCESCRPRNAAPLRTLLSANSLAGANMKLPYFAFLALLGGLAFLILFIADRERKLGEDRLSVYRIPHSALYADPNLRLVSAYSPYLHVY